MEPGVALVHTWPFRGQLPRGMSETTWSHSFPTGEIWYMSSVNHGKHVGVQGRCHTCVEV